MRNLSDFSLRAAIPLGFTLLSLAGMSQAASTPAGPPTVLAAAAAATDKDKKDDTLDEVVVTGSLIPQVRAETSTPVTVITAEDIKDKGFETVAEALQHSSFATGAVQGPQFVNGFTPGVQTLSLFGLSPSYTKYLIDGRPLADYPALYNGSDSVNSISGIPTMLVDHIDILPGAQSSIYGSDAIAGVINIVLKKKAEGFEADVRYGWTKDGGGVDKRLALSDGFNIGPVNVVVGAQYEKTDPIWGYQRPLTNQYNPNGTSAQTAERDFLILGIFGPAGDGSNAYYFQDPTACGASASLFGHGIAEQSRPNRGNYCGTFKSGFYTVNNGSEATQGYLHASDDVNEHLQIFTDVLIDHEWTKFSNGTDFYSNFDPSVANYYDPRLAGGQGDYVSVLQHIFAPEEAGGLQNTLNKNTTNSIRATLGAEGKLFAGFSYIADFTYTENKLTEDKYTALSGPINAFFANIYGPQLGLDPNGFGVPVYQPNYAQFYTPLTPAQYASFNANLNAYSRTEESLARVMVTDPTLFPLPGGNAGIAVVGEGGAQGWDYSPDPNYLDGGSFLYTSVAGSGHRSRYAATVELKLPVVKMLTFDLSSRYDAYKIAGTTVDKATYNIGVEFRPHPTILFRGRYGTAFKAPTLADEFQGKSGFFQSVTDYYQCAQLGFSVANGNIANCTLAPAQVQGTTEGNPGLKPITAKVGDIGIAWTPFDRFSFTTDFIRWNILNEIQEQPTDQLLREEAACRSINGAPPELDPTSPTCVAVLTQVTRDQFGNLATVDTPKVNVAQETLNVLSVALNYTLVTPVAGNFTFEGSYSDILKHSFTQFAGDTVIDLINNPFFSSEFKTKENFAVTWQFHRVGVTGYVERYGRTPNNLAQGSTEGYAAPGAGKLGTWTLANFSARYEVIDGLTLSGNVVNAFNKMPPVDNSFAGTSNQPYNIFNYNNYGRSYFVEANYKFGQSK